MANYYHESKIKVSAIADKLSDDTEAFLEFEREIIPEMLLDYNGMIARIDVDHPQVNELTQEFLSNLTELLEEIGG